MSAEHMPAEVFPPGEFIKDEIEERGWTQEYLAELLGSPVQLVNEIIAGKCAITVKTAQGLSAAFGTSAQFWMNMESMYRSSQAPTSDADAVEERARS